MIEKLPSNLTIVDTTKATSIASVLKDMCITTGHFTNGVYGGLPRKTLAPTVLAGFQYVADREEVPASVELFYNIPPLFIALNSDKSAEILMDQKIKLGTATQAQKDAIEDQYTRALKVTVPLAYQHRRYEREVIALFYDEETPKELYTTLKNEIAFQETLFKYGTNEKEGIIVGGDCFKTLYAFFYPKDEIKSLTDELTSRTGQDGFPKPVDLRVVVGPHGAPYLTRENECLFPLAPENRMYGPKSDIQKTL